LEEIGSDGMVRMV